MTQDANSAAPSLVTPVVLAGGVGSRLWPLSRQSRPKQFLPLVTERSMLQDTLLRLGDRGLFGAPAIVCHARYGEEVAAQARSAGVSLDGLLLEPAARNSAPAIAAAALHYARRDPEALLLVLPADHVIDDAGAFNAAVRAAAEVARTGRLTTFGVTPDRPETGYGYIRGGAPIAGTEGREIAAFVEKPDLATAEAYLASGEYFWNSGMFLFRAGDMVAELRLHAPQVLSAAEAALDRAAASGPGLLLDRAAFETAEEVSIDYAVMEKTARAAVAPGAFPWSDIGAWDALAEKAAQDDDGNTARGTAQLIDARNVYVRSEGPYVAAIGVEDLVIVATEDAVLITRKDMCQQVKIAAKSHAAEVGDG
ncbi:MAG: mannose-1-phosphate guanylyltransferase/mannose-6-phosphate isomerase [Pseudomonadota bacterium]